MSRPGDPGYAKAARATASSHDKTRRQWTLERRLVIVVTGLFALLSIIVGAVSVTIFAQNSLATVDADLRSSISRAELNVQMGLNGQPGAQVLLTVAGQSVGTIAATARDDGMPEAWYIADNSQILRLPAAIARKLASVAPDNSPHSLSAGPQLGEYRAISQSKTYAPGARIIMAVPLGPTQKATSRLAITITGVALAGLLLAFMIGGAIIRRALAPLERVTSTAQRVSKLPLDRGDVALAERVTVTDPGTEVGRLGTAFNRMLGHVSAALTAREQSERKVRRFVADASHELRTPLASIRGYAELTRLHGGKLPQQVVHAIGRIEAESVRMTELVEDLLLLARLDEGRELVFSRVELRQLAVDAIGDAQVSGSDHDWEAELEETPIAVMGDEYRLRQVLANLLTNARVHTPSGTLVALGLRLGEQGDTAVITVTDNGQGIPEGLVNSLFERFARGDASRSRIAGSTGLGLAIVRAVVIAHHGKVSVDSVPGKTVFTVELPLAPRKETTPAGLSAGLVANAKSASSISQPAQKLGE